MYRDFHDMHAVRSHGGALAALSSLSSAFTQAGAVWLLNGGLLESFSSETGCGTHEIFSNAMPKQLVKLHKSAV